MRFFLIFLFLFSILQADMQEGIKEYKNGNEQKALELFRDTCDKKDIFSCMNIGQMFLTGKVLEKNIDYAKEFYKRSCDLKVWNGCFVLGQIYFQEKSYEKSLEYLNISCDKNFTEACLLSSAIYKKIYKNDKQYVLYLDKSCQKDNYLGCSSLGKIYYMGSDGVQKDNTKAFELFDKACTQGNINEACLTKAYMYTTAVGVEQDYVKAEMIFKDLCTKEYKEGCKGLDNFYEEINVKTNKSYLASKQKRLDKQKEKNYIVDSNTELMWQDDIDSVTILRDYKGAMKYCEDLILGNFDDWRLPNKVELITLYYKNNPTKFLDTLKNTKLVNYWSSSINYNFKESGYAASYNDESYLFNDVVGTPMELKYNVRCVRGKELDANSYDINTKRKELVKLRRVK